MFKKLKEKVSTVTTELESSARTRIQGLNSQASQYIDQFVNNSTTNSGKDELNDGNGKGVELKDGSIASNSSTADLLQLSAEETDQKPTDSKLDSNLDSFSLVELDDDLTSADQTANTTATAVGQQNSSSSVSENDSFFSMTPIQSPTNHFVPQSDIESEYESETYARSHPNVVDNVSKEQLIELCIKLKTRGRKYRDRWTEVVSAYRYLNDEKEKLRKVLSDTQDKALRRISEMKEQCLLEQQAKRHLEENLRVVIEEKDETIKVLQTKIGFLNTGNQLNGESSDLLLDLNNDQNSGPNKELTEKVVRLETLLTRCKESLKTSKEKVSLLNKENEELIAFKEKFETISKELEVLKSEKEGNTQSFAEAKHKLHEELEARNIVVRELQDQLERKRQDFLTYETDLKSKQSVINELEERITGIEKTAEEDKQNLIQELSRGKSAAIHLIREETEKKLHNLDEEWKQKYSTLVDEKSVLNRQLSESESNHKQLILDENRKQIDETAEQNRQLKTEMSDCQTRLNQTIDELNRAEFSRESEKSNLEKLLSDSESKSSELLAEVERLNQRSANLDELKLELEKTESLLRSAEQKTDDARHELESLRNQLEDKELLLSQLTEEKTHIEEQLKNRLNELQNELQEKMDLLSKTEKLVNSAENDLKERLNELENELREKSDLLFKSEELLKSTENKFNKRINGLENDLKEKLEIISKSEEVMKSEENDLKNRLMDLENELIQQKQKTNELEQQLKESEDLITKLETDLQEFGVKYEILETISLEKNEKNDKLLNDLTEVQNNCSNFEQNFNESLNRIKEFETELSGKCQELTECVSQRDESVAQLNELRTHLNRSENLDKEFETKLKESEETIHKLIKQLQTETEKCENYAKQMESLSNEKSDYLKNIAENESNYSELQNVTSDLRTELSELKNEYQICREKLNQNQETNDLEINELKKLLKNEETKSSEISEKFNSINEQNSVLIDLESQLKTKEQTFLAENQSLKQLLEEKESFIQEIKSKEVLTESELNGLKTELKLSKEKLTSDSEIFQTEITDNRNNCHKLEKSLAEWQQNNKELVDLNEMLTKEKTDLINENQSLKHSVESLQNNIIIFNEQLNEKQLDSENCKQIASELQTIRKEYNSLQVIRSELNEKFEKLSETYDLKCNESQGLSDLMENLKSDSSQLSSDLEEKTQLITGLESELKQKIDLINDLKTENVSKTESIEVLNKLKEENNSLNLEINKYREEVSKYKTLDSEIKELNKTNEELKSSFSEKSVQYMNQIEALKTQMSEQKEQNQSIVDKLYKQLDIRETQLDESLMQVESRHHSTAQELLETKCEILRLKQELSEKESKNDSFEKEINDLNQKLSDMQIVNQTDGQNAEKNSLLIEKIHSLEAKLLEKENELDERVEKFNESEDKLIFEYKKQISSLENELSDKNTALEEVHEYYQQRLMDKDSELKSLHSEFGSDSVNEHTYQVKAMQNSLLQYQEENVRLKELLNIRRFAETQNSENTPLLTGVHLPEPTEYEYLRNILFEFMVGREPVTLSKVISAVMRFSADQTEQIIKKQESNQLTSLRQFKPI